MSLPSEIFPDQPFTRTERFGSPAEWFAFLGGPVIWIAHFLVMYGAVYPACNRDWNFLLYLPTLIAVPLAIAAGVVSWRLWRRTKPDPGSEPFQPRSRSRFFGLAGLFMSAIFLLAILFEGAAPLLLDPCGSGA